jgi:hypothetical protein
MDTSTLMLEIKRFLSTIEVKPGSRREILSREPAAQTEDVILPQQGEGAVPLVSGHFMTKDAAGI